MECLRAAPFADWNEWYGAAVTIHACSFTSLSLSLALTLPHLSFKCNKEARKGEGDKQTWEEEWKKAR